MVRNAGKFGKPKRGGGKHFTNARVLKAENEGGNSEEESSEEEEEEDEESFDDSDGFGGTVSNGPSTSAQAGPSMMTISSGAEKLKPGEVDKFGNVVQEPEMTKREAKKAAKAKEEAAAAANAAKASQKQKQTSSNGQAGGKGVKFESSDEDESSSEEEDAILNAGNANKGLNKQMKMSSLGETAKKPAAAARAPEPMNRKEREEAQKKAARERYLEMHRAGKTDEAKADLARLAKIRKDREEAAARKLAEKASAEEAKQKTLIANGRIKK